jgi:hypothetical protein
MVAAAPGTSIVEYRPGVAAEDVAAEDVAAEDVAAEDVAAEDVAAGTSARADAAPTISTSRCGVLSGGRPPCLRVMGG